jgi:transposase
LIVSKEGLPISYEIFPGNTYEGKTLSLSIEKYKESFEIDNIIIVADRGIMNKNNIEYLTKIGAKYIIGAKIKNMSNNISSKILEMENYLKINEDLSILEINLNNNEKLILTYSKERDRKDKYDREKLIEKIKNKISNKTTKLSSISSSPIYKYLKLIGENIVEIDEQKIIESSKYDGISGIITNTSNLSNLEIINQYKSLWQVEKAFRVTKHDLKIRPIYHFKPNRIEAHIAISFIAYSLTKNLEYRLSIQKKSISINKIKEILMDVQTSIFINKKIKYAIPSSISKEAMMIYNLMNKKRELTPYIISKM